MTLEKDGFNVTAISFGSHTGTHVDAPSHSIKDAATITDLNLSLFQGPALVLDVRGKKPRERITWENLEPLYAHRMREGQIVVLYTGWSTYWQSPHYIDHPYLDRSAAEGLIKAGIRTVAMDCMSPDETFHEGSQGTGDYIAHEIILSHGGVIAENLRNIESIAEGNFMIRWCFTLQVSLHEEEEADDIGVFDERDVTRLFNTVNMNDPLTIAEETREYRLLFRGSLSLPDSDVVLDGELLLGITFVAETFPSSPSRLLNSPIALALESMRGRPSLRLISVVKTSDVNYECPGDVHMYIQPRSVLASRFFENILCTESLNESGLTQHAIRLGFGDGHGADDSDILIFGRLSPFQSILRLSVGRIIPQQVLTAKRKPRPDDPAPRIPSAFVPTKKTRKRENHIWSDSNQSKRVEATRSQGQYKSLSLPEDELDSTQPERPTPKQFSSNVVSVRETANIETLNKAVVKKLTVDRLSQCGVFKDHPEFRDLFNHTVHSVGFALRRVMKNTQVDSEDAKQLINLHVKLYLDGHRGVTRINNN
ncbi:hypothetical protein Clacol_002626 [Clathrus columnatus]|uniref:Sld7 C-terminal domain-containing protein n=1 Tax=Clathrus columnatus TaxID=1419009 RepID=A0AAV5A935_9AGAM|nr:hypothetical protein Clacol_002626 [Clathrus columnatus]